MNRINELIRNISPPQPEMLIRAQERLDNLTKPKGSLGKLEESAKKVVAITNNMNPSMRRKVIFVFAADHGVAEEGVSAYPRKVTSQMVYNFLQGGAGINVLAKHAGAEVVVVDMGVAEKLRSHPSLKVRKIGYGTDNFLKKKAMTRKQAKAAIRAGIEVFEEEHRKNSINIVGLGDMGIANTTASSAILASITGRKPEKVTGRGTGVDDRMWQRKVQVIEKAIQCHCPDAKDPLDILSKVGGYEIGGIAGCILAAAYHRVPVVIDGFISTAGALIATGFSSDVREYLFASHLSREKGHRIALDHLRLAPLLDLNLRLGEGTGAALGICLIEASVRLLTEMATFEEARVSRE